ERDDAGDAADHDEHLQGDGERQARREQLAEVVLAGQTDAQAAADEHHVQAQDREQPDQAELLTQARNDVVALRQGGQVWTTLTETRADEATVSEAEDALHQLVA